MAAGPPGLIFRRGRPSRPSRLGAPMLTSPRWWCLQHGIRTGTADAGVGDPMPAPRVVGVDFVGEGAVLLVYVDGDADGEGFGEGVGDRFGDGGGGARMGEGVGEDGGPGGWEEGWVEGGGHFGMGKVVCESGLSS